MITRVGHFINCAEDILCVSRTVRELAQKAGLIKIDILNVIINNTYKSHGETGYAHEVNTVFLIHAQQM